ncbi:MAG TPA: NAD(P)-dependent oxidoreductase [Candidatus Acidoferrales bacterium]|nr:NAD(P)-dependent oxidoreductase [Candidatus Acidoferrales bacterium]
MSKQRVALIGLGIMGSGMAGRLLSAGFPLTIYNRNRDKAAPFESAGAVLAASPRAAASRAEVVISMVADDVASRAVWLGESGALAGAAPGTVLIESSTLSVTWVRELAEAASQKHCELLDAPVTGSKPQAANGELLFLVGGSETALATARPMLASLSRDAVYLGPTGSGALMKLINNFLCGVQAASLAEAAALIAKAGLNREKALAVLANGAPGSPLVKTVVARVAAGDPAPSFVLRLMAKDLSYAIEEGTRNHVNLQTALPALAEFQRAIAAGYGDRDFSAVIEAIQR